MPLSIPPMIIVSVSLMVFIASIAVAGIVEMESS